MALDHDDPFFSSFDPVFATEQMPPIPLFATSSKPSPTCICGSELTRIESDSNDTKCNSCCQSTTKFTYSCPFGVLGTDHPDGYNLCETCALNTSTLRCFCGVVMKPCENASFFGVSLPMFCTKCKHGGAAMSCPRGSDTNHPDGMHLCAECGARKMAADNRDLFLTKPPDDPHHSPIASLPPDLQISIADWCSALSQTFMTLICLNKSFAEVLSIDSSKYAVRLNRIWERLCRMKYPHMAKNVRLRRWDKMYRHRVESVGADEIMIENCTFGFEEETADTTGLVDGMEWIFRCPLKYENLSGLGTSKFCEECHRTVYLVQSEFELKAHVDMGHCVALDLNGNVPQLQPMTMGLMRRPDFF